MNRIPRLLAVLMLVAGLSGLSAAAIAQGQAADVGSTHAIPRGRAVVPPAKPPVETWVVPGLHEKVKGPRKGPAMNARMTARARIARDKADQAAKAGL